MDRPLRGIRVVAFEQALSLPFGTYMLAEMGADVVKIERRGRGDVIRGWDEAVHGLSTGFVWVNAGKRDVAVDMARPEGREVVKRLALQADVFVENFSPGVAARMGLADADLRPLSPRLVYCSLSGYGQSGPYRDRKAYDLLVQGEAGVLLTSGYPEAPARVGVPITDLIAGVNAALGVTLALYERERTGQGSFLDVSMFDGAVAWLGYFPQRIWHEGKEPPRTGMRHQYITPYGPFQARDGRYLNLAVASEDDWKRFCEQVVRRPEWLAEPRFSSVSRRTRHKAEVDRLVEEAIAQEPLEEWERRLEAARLPYGRVRPIAEVLEHPQLKSRRLVVDVQSEFGPLPWLRFPLAPPDAERRLPGLGEHTEEVLLEIGYGEAEISALRAAEVI